MPKTTGPLLRLGRALRYRPLPITGQRVVIESLDAVEHVLRQLATPWLTRDSRWEGCKIELGLAKYGLLDRECNVDARHLEGALRGIPALLANGFVREAPDDSIGEVRAYTESWLTDLASDLDRCVLKLFLHDGLPDDMRFAHNRQRFQNRLLPELLPDYFPRPFVVTDACITNAPSIWLAKHFYL